MLAIRISICSIYVAYVTLSGLGNRSGFHDANVRLLKRNEAGRKPSYPLRCEAPDIHLTQVLQAVSSAALRPLNPYPSPPGGLNKATVFLMVKLKMEEVMGGGTQH